MNPVTLFLVAGLMVATLSRCERTQAEPPPALADVPAALEALKSPGESVEFHCVDPKLPAGGHLQGIQAVWDAAHTCELFIISHDSLTVAYLAVVEVQAPTDDFFTNFGLLLRIQELPSDGQSPPLRHAGGTQLSGTILAVGVEDNQAKKRAQIQFWDLADSERLRQLKHLTIPRSSQIPKQATAGAVGLVEREKDHLLAVGNWDCRAIDFYVSNGKPLTDPACRFKHTLQWQADAAATADWKPDAVRGAYQSLNFVRDKAGNLFLLGFETTLARQDVIDLFAVDLTAGPERALRKLERRVVQLSGDNHFRYAGGAVVRDGELLILSSERNFNLKGVTRLNVLRNAGR